MTKIFLILSSVMTSKKYNIRRNDKNDVKFLLLIIYIIKYTSILLVFIYNNNTKYFCHFVIKKIKK